MSTAFRLNIRRGSCFHRYANSNPARWTHPGARLNFRLPHRRSHLHPYKMECSSSLSSDPRKSPFRTGDSQTACPHQSLDILCDLLFIRLFEIAISIQRFLTWGTFADNEIPFAEPLPLEAPKKYGLNPLLRRQSNECFHQINPRDALPRATQQFDAHTTPMPSALITSFRERCMNSGSSTMRKMIIVLILMC